MTWIILQQTNYWLLYIDLTMPNLRCLISFGNNPIPKKYKGKFKSYPVEIKSLLTEMYWFQVSRYNKSQSMNYH